MLNVVFVGGGSARLLPILRKVFQNPAVFDGGSIRLVDRELSRAEAVGRLLMKSPEFSKMNCKVVWSSDFVSQLEGADAVYLTMAARREPSWTQAAMISARYGYICSDQLSINGAFLSARLGKTILTFARQMERYAPQARMLIFPNPVAAYAAGVERHTKIEALGICGGYYNHTWDLTRICFGRDECDPSWEPVVAGVNHLSFILCGTYRGTPIHDLLRKVADDPDWEPIRLPTMQGILSYAEQNSRAGQKIIVDIFRKYGAAVFSSEADGSMHIAKESWDKAREKETAENFASFDPVRAEKEQQKGIAERFRTLHDAATGAADPDWDAPLFRPVRDISVPIFNALAEQGKMRIAASRLNRGAVRGIPDDNVVEYSMELSGREITPFPDLYIPHPFQGLIASLSEFHTLLGDFAATQDPKIFAQALEAYPMHKFEASRKAYLHEMFDLYSDLDPAFRQAEQYLI